MTEDNLTLIAQIGKLSLRIDNKTRENGKLVVIIADKGTNVMSVTLDDLVQAVHVINELGTKYYTLPPEE